MNENTQNTNSKRYCKYCGKEFEPQYKTQKYCCRECRRQVDLEAARAWRRRKKEEREANPEKGICPVCGKEFPAGYNRKYCSEECKREAQIKRSREYHHKVATGEKRFGKDFRRSKAFDIEEEMRTKGLSYADYQKAQTLRMVKEGLL